MKKVFCDGCGKEMTGGFIHGRLEIEDFNFMVMGEEKVDWDLCIFCRSYLKRLLVPLKGSIHHG